MLQRYGEMERAARATKKEKDVKAKEEKANTRGKGKGKAVKDAGMVMGGSEGAGTV